MKDLTLYLLSFLISKPESMSVEETENDYGTVLTIKVDKEDMGRVIGKGGKIIRSLRDVVKILAVKQNKHVDLVLAE